jgi:hypothetical protein
MRHDEYQDGIVDWCPAKYVVLTQRPVPVQFGFELHKVATLPESHFLGDASKLVEIRRKVSYSPNAGLRKIVEFHELAQSDLPATRFSARVYVANAVIESNQLLCSAQVSSRSARTWFKFGEFHNEHDRDSLHKNSSTA